MPAELENETQGGRAADSERTEATAKEYLKYSSSADRPSHLNKLSNRFVRCCGIRRKVMMSLAREDDEFRIGNLAREFVSAGEVRLVTGAVMLIIADENERWDTNILQSIGVIVLLAGKYEVKIVFQRSDAGKSHLEKFFNQIGMRGDKFFSPSSLDGVLANVLFEAQPNHVPAHRQRDAFGPRMRRSAGGEDKFFDFARMVQSQ